jgi:hypothetical protein
MSMFLRTSSSGEGLACLLTIALRAPDKWFEIPADRHGVDGRARTRRSSEAIAIVLAADHFMPDVKAFGKPCQDTATGCA